MLRQILRGHRSARFRCYLRVPFLKFDTPIIYHLLVYCFGSFLLQDLFLCLQVFAFKGQNIAFTVNEKRIVMIIKMFLGKKKHLL